MFVKIKENENGSKISDDKKSSNKELFSYFETVLPTYDKEKVYASDIKKIVNWYNLLIDNDIDFETEESTTDIEDAASEKDDINVASEEEDSTEK